MLRIPLLVACFLLAGCSPFPATNAEAAKAQAQLQSKFTFAQRAKIYHAFRAASKRAEDDAKRACPEPGFLQKLNPYASKCGYESGEHLEAIYYNQLRLKYRLTETEQALVFAEQSGPQNKR